jgi:Periplasmic copper-binding protein (NosD)
VAALGAGSGTGDLRSGELGNARVIWGESVVRPRALQSRMRRIAILIGWWMSAAAAVSAPRAFGMDYWVGPGGRDGDGRGSRARPWATLQHAADRVRPGDTVHVRDGQYVGFDLRRGGTKDQPVAFIADGKQVRISRRNRATPDGINMEGASYVLIEGFIVDGMPRAGVRAAGGSHVRIQSNRTSHNGVWGIFTAFCDDVAVVGNQTSRSVKEHGIYVSNSGDRPHIAGNISWSNRGCGIHMNGDISQGGDGMISGALVENNVIYDNGRGGGSGINCDGVQDSVFCNNLLYNNHASGISLYRDNSADESKNNRIVNNTIVVARDGRWAVNLGAGTGNTVWNNIIISRNPSAGSIKNTAVGMSGFRSDYNIVTERFSRDDGDHVLPLEAWSEKTGHDRHTKVAGPSELFIDESQSDFHLRSNSPAIDRADPAASPRQDLEGHPRPSGSGPDIGAFETTVNKGAGTLIPQADAR